MTNFSRFLDLENLEKQPYFFPFSFTENTRRFYVELKPGRYVTFCCFSLITKCQSEQTKVVNEILKTTLWLFHAIFYTFSLKKNHEQSVSLILIFQCFSIEAEGIMPLFSVVLVSAGGISNFMLQE